MHTKTEELHEDVSTIPENLIKPESHQSFKKTKEGAALGGNS